MAKVKIWCRPFNKALEPNPWLSHPLAEDQPRFTQAAAAAKPPPNMMITAIPPDAFDWVRKAPPIAKKSAITVKIPATTSRRLNSSHSLSHGWRTGIRATFSHVKGNPINPRQHPSGYLGPNLEPPEEAPQA